MYLYLSGVSQAKKNNFLYFIAVKGCYTGSLVLNAFCEKKIKGKYQIINIC